MSLSTQQTIMNLSSWQYDISHRSLRIVTLDDGNLSFTVGILTHDFYVPRARRDPSHRYILHTIPLAIYATVYDSEREELMKYIDAWVHIRNIQQHGALVMYNINACDIQQSIYRGMIRLKHKH